ncbi:class I SAM-dependent methyltransferase [Candidatus Woesearchaeota archaeon]|nr:class I SAM-dependent methyltransferase [Candidatus Woesearchaeota archaeon]
MSTTNSIQKFYEHHYGKLGFDSADKFRLNLMIQYVGADKTQNKKVLDIGCSKGMLLEMLKTKGNHIGFGIDISPTQVKIVKKKGFNTECLDLNKDKLPYQNNYFDYIFATELLEHLFNPMMLFKEIKRVLKPQGLFLITAPNDLGRINKRLKILFGNPVLCNINSGHIRFFTYNYFKQILEENFKVIKSRGFGGHLDIIQRLWPSMLANGFVAVCNKKNS